MYEFTGVVDEGFSISISRILLPRSIDLDTAEASGLSLFEVTLVFVAATVDTGIVD